MREFHVGKALTEYGIITEKQLQDALVQFRDRKEEKTFGMFLVDSGVVTEKVLLESVGRIMDLKNVDLGLFRIEEQAVEKIPKQLALKYHVIAVSIEKQNLTVATADPYDLYALEDIRLVTRLRLNLVLADRASIRHAIELHYSGIDARAAAKRAGEAAEISKSFADGILFSSGEVQSPIVRLLNSLLIKAYNTNVTDIHIEPQEHETVIRMRRDGQLLHYMTLQSSVHQGLVARTKILARLDIAEKRRPQDGHFKLTLDEKEMNIRVSFVPTSFGEKGVLRFLNMNVPIDRSHTFGMTSENYQKLKQLLMLQSGILYLTGPTGSGKTTTLYFILEYLRSRAVNISTIEDPVERTIPGINQMQIHEKAGITFETGLRALLRQDPDVLMIGETRDRETAGIAARAAITGHLVCSTLHTNDAVSSIVRLRDIGLPSYLIAASLSGLVAQRLMRKICPHCGETYEAGADDYRILYGREQKPDEHLMLKRRKGCFLCNDTGYKGRIAIHEVIWIDSAMSRMISDEVPLSEMKAYAAASQKYTSLREEAARLVLSGTTGVEELVRVMYSMDDIRDMGSGYKIP